MLYTLTAGRACEREVVESLRAVRVVKRASGLEGARKLVAVFPEVGGVGDGLWVGTGGVGG